MTEKGWICLTCLLVVIVLVWGMAALWRIGSNLASIAKLLDVTNGELHNLYCAQKHTESTISEAIKGVSEATYNVYESMFDNAEVTIRRNGIEEDEDDDI